VPPYVPNGFWQISEKYIGKRGFASAFLLPVCHEVSLSV
jgi:hypothetical protein